MSGHPWAMSIHSTLPEGLETQCALGARRWVGLAWPFPGPSLPHGVVMRPRRAGISCSKGIRLGKRVGAEC
eukprot:6148672-Alexandrium_andersonii.AAC.1